MNKYVEKQLDNINPVSTLTVPTRILIPGTSSLTKVFLNHAISIKFEYMVFLYVYMNYSKISYVH